MFIDQFIRKLYHSSGTSAKVAAIVAFRHVSTVIAARSFSSSCNTNAYYIISTFSIDAFPFSERKNLIFLHQVFEYNSTMNDQLNDKQYVFFLRVAQTH